MEKVNELGKNEGEKRAGREGGERGGVLKGSNVWKE